MAHSFKHDGRAYTLTLDHGIYRLRCRAAGRKINFSTGCSAARPAEAAARVELAKLQRSPLPPAKVTLEDVVTAYKAIPKRASADSVVTNVSRLRGIVQAVHGKKLSEFKLRDLNPDLWTAYMEHRLGGKLDLATRRPENAAINSGIVCARSLFIPALIPFYKEHGIIIPEGIMQAHWLPRMKQPPPQAKGDDLLEAWAKLRDTDPALWFAIGLARFAGLRRREIQYAARHWLIPSGAGVKLEIRDRPDEGYMHKTGEMYTALVINPEFAAALLKLPAGFIVRPPDKEKGRPWTRPWWFRTYPQAWCKPFTGTATKPLHRLRGLYLTELAKLTENAVLARLEGVKEAAANAGHTSTATTLNHYISPDALR